MAVKPIGDRILIKRVEAESKTSGGIILPDAAKEKPKEGIVVALGTGKVLDSGKSAKFDVKKGDRVVFTSYAGTEVKIKDEEHLIMNTSDILAVLG